jgi:hypothetical protein
VSLGARHDVLAASHRDPLWLQLCLVGIRVVLIAMALWSRPRR